MQQHGVALMVMLTVLTLWGLSLFIGQFSAAQYRTHVAQDTAQALAEAKVALIGDAISRINVTDAGYLRLPDLGYTSPSGPPTEGFSSSNFTGNARDLSVVGKLPWKTLSTNGYREANECLWYVVSGRFKIASKTLVFNWDTQGQLDVIDGNGNTVASNLAALLVGPGAPLNGQDRSLSNPAYTECGGNYDARNYLDTYSAGDAVSGEVNYFTGSINNRVAPNANNKKFVMTNSKYYNDNVLHITTEDIFLPLIRRDSFKAAIADLLNNPTFVSQLKTTAISAGKGTDNIQCRCDNFKCDDNDTSSTLSPAQESFYEFCKNWKEMLLLKKLQTPGAITVDGTSSEACSHVLFFSGTKAVGQSRSTNAEKADVSNYLEGVNASSFSAASAPAWNFSGASTFDWSSPETDLVRCVP